MLISLGALRLFLCFDAHTDCHSDYFTPIAALIADAAI